MNLKRLTTNDFNLLIAGANIYEKNLRDKDFYESTGLEPIHNYRRNRFDIF